MTDKPSISPRAASRSRIMLLLMRTALLIALVATAILFVDYHLAGAPTYCGAGSGCAKVRSSAYSHLFGVSLPRLGLGVLGAVYLLGCFVKEHVHKLMLAATLGIVALGAAVFVGLQAFVVGAFCVYCMVVDVSVIAAAALGGVYCKTALREGTSTESTSSRFAWLAAGIAFAAAPLLWGPPAAPVKLPTGVTERHVAGKVNVVMFTDFECPFCRKLHPEFEAIKKRYGDRVAVSRVMVPLEFHRGAEPAARAYLCAPEAQREALANRLYSAPRDQLTRDGMLAFAGALGVESSAFDRCMKSQATTDSLSRSKDLFREAALQGLPSTFVDDFLVSGADPDGLWRMVGKAVSGGGQHDVLYMVIFLVLAWMAAAFVSFRTWLRDA